MARLSCVLSKCFCLIKPFDHCQETLSICLSPVTCDDCTRSFKVIRIVSQNVEHLVNDDANGYHLVFVLYAVWLITVVYNNNL